MSTFTIPTIYTAIDKFSPAVRAMERANSSFGNRMEAVSIKSERMFKKLTPGLSDATRQMAQMASSAALLGTAFGGIVFSGKSLMEYEDATKSLEAVTGVAFDKFKNDVSELSLSSKKSSIDVVKSFEVIGSAMSEYLDNPKALRQIADAGITLSKASRMELEPTMQALTSVMNQFGLKAEFATDTINRLTAGEIVGSISTAKIAESLQQFGAVASANNVSVSESVALVEVLGKKLPTEQLGTASRNLITFMSAAKGMPKEAQKELIKHGVNLDLLMDKHTSFGAKLKELSKIQGDAIAMEKFFGRENLAAGTTIFQNLALYDEWTGRIKTTNEAQNQATINSNTLSNKLSELKNSWTNMLTASDNASKGLNYAKRIIGFLSDNLDTIVTIGVGFIGFLAAWKIANLAIKGSLIATRAISTAFYIYDMVKYVASTQGITVATAAWEVAQSSLNAVILANPVGMFILAIAALGVAIYGVTKAIELFDEPLNKSFERKEQLRQEAFSVMELRDQYFALGKTLKEAEKMAISKTAIGIQSELVAAKMKLASPVEAERQQGVEDIANLANRSTQLGRFIKGDAWKADMGQRYANSAEINSFVAGAGTAQEVEKYDWINPKQAQSQATANAMTNNIVVNNALPGTTVEANGKTVTTQNSNTIVPSISSTMSAAR